MQKTWLVTKRKSRCLGNPLLGVAEQRFGNVKFSVAQSALIPHWEQVVNFRFQVISDALPFTLRSR